MTHISLRATAVSATTSCSPSLAVVSEWTAAYVVTRRRDDIFLVTRNSKSQNTFASRSPMFLIGCFVEYLAKSHWNLDIYWGILATKHNTYSAHTQSQGITIYRYDFSTDALFLLTAYSMSVENIFLTYSNTAGWIKWLTTVAYCLTENAVHLVPTLPLMISNVHASEQQLHRYYTGTDLGFCGCPIHLKEAPEVERRRRRGRSGEWAVPSPQIIFVFFKISKW